MIKKITEFFGVLFLVIYSPYHLVWRILMDKGPEGSGIESAIGEFYLNIVAVFSGIIQLGLFVLFLIAFLVYWFAF